MKIINLHVEDIKRVKSVDITPKHTSGLTTIGGKNGQGKTSILDSIMYAMGGRSMIDEDPIRHGETKGKITVKLDNGLIVTRVLTGLAGSGGTLSVSLDGTKCDKPQSVLDKLYGTLTFDPLAFLTMSAKDRAAKVAELTGLDLTDLSARRKELEAERLMRHREMEHAKKLHVEYGSPDATLTPVSMDGLLQQANMARQHNAAVSARRQQRESVQREWEQVRVRLHELETWLANDAGNPVADMVDVTAIEQQCGLVAEHNAKCARNVEAVRFANGFATAHASHAEIQKTIEALDLERMNRIRSAVMPIEGLSFDGEQIRFNNIVFGQLSDSEKLRVSVAIGAAMNPSLQVMLIRNGSLLDSDSMALLQAFAVATDMQIWIEIVGDAGEVIIEDGLVK